MTKLDKAISIAKKLIDMPYNQFNLENYYNILEKNFKQEPNLIYTEKNQPIKLMSGGNDWAAIVTNISAEEEQKIKGRKIYLVGKGILFDSGGLDLKTGRHGMKCMHGDKAGAIIALSVANYLKGNVVAICPITTNFIQNSLITPGDILKIGNKRVEVNNTDAEGRLILAEAISNLNASKNDIIITVATLTGCCEYAVDKATGVLGGAGLKPKSLVWKYLEAAQEANEVAWALPMFNYMQDFYKKQPFKNAEERIKAGTSEAAMFLKQFVKYPDNWIHLDIASSAHKNDKATGQPIKSLINFIRKIQ